jgi:hypothetical protein
MNNCARRLRERPKSSWTPDQAAAVACGGLCLAVAENSSRSRPLDAAQWRKGGIKEQTRKHSEPQNARYLKTLPF